MDRARTIGAIIPRRAAVAPLAPALLAPGLRISALHLATLVDGLAYRVLAAGVAPGQRVALLLPDELAFVLAHGAAARAAAVVAPLPAGLPPAALVPLLAQADPALLITDEFHARALGEALPREHLLLGDLGTRTLPEGEGEVHAPDPGAPAAGASAAAHSTPHTKPVPDGASSDAAPVPRAGALPPEPQPNDPALLFLTSGSSGAPKAVTLSHAQALAGLDAWVECWGFDEHTVAAMAAPFHHVVYDPLVLGVLRAGGAAALLPRRTPRAVARTVADLDVTALMGPPAFWCQWLDDRRLADRPPPPSLVTVIHGAAPMPDAAAAELRQHFPAARAFDCYGLTETASALSVLRPEHAAARSGSVGRPHPGVELALLDDDGQPVPADQPGEVCVRGPHVITSYGVAALDRTRFFGPWLRTGDRGRLDDDGFLYLLGRVDDVINVAGEKVAASRVCELLEADPAVREAGAVALPDPVRGQRVGAAVVLRAGCQTEPRALLQRLRRELPAACVPRRVVLLDELPRNATGKLDRAALARALAPC